MLDKTQVDQLIKQKTAINPRYLPEYSAETSFPPSPRC